MDDRTNHREKFHPSDSQSDGSERTSWLYALPRHDDGIRVQRLYRSSSRDNHRFSLDVLVNRVLDFLSFPIPDGNVNPDDQKVLDFCLELCQRIQRGQVLLVHCW